MQRKETELIERVLRTVSPFVAEQHGGRAALGVTTKTEVNDLLTEADLETQRRITERLLEAFPDDPIVAEELGLDRIPNPHPARCWFVDPIDGTQNFVAGLFPEFGISIAFAEDGVLCAGGVAFPLPGEVFLAERGEGAYRNGVSIRVSETAGLDASRIEFDFGGLAHREESLRRLVAPMRAAGQIRSQGSAVVGLCSVAAGDSEAYCHVGLAPWDYAAGALIVEEAGGRCTGLDGEPPNVFQRVHAVIATNGAVHDELLSAIAAG